MLAASRRLVRTLSTALDETFPKETQAGEKCFHPSKKKSLVFFAPDPEILPQINQNFLKTVLPGFFLYISALTELTRRQCSEVKLGPGNLNGTDGRVSEWVSEKRGERYSFVTPRFDLSEIFNVGSSESGAAGGQLTRLLSRQQSLSGQRVEYFWMRVVREKRKKKRKAGKSKLTSRPWPLNLASRLFV